MKWDVVIGDDVAVWLDRLDKTSYELVIAALNVLSEAGPSLGRPLVDTIAGSKVKNMKELRPGSGGRSEVRILFAFDPRRRAILLVAGDKSGKWRSWYKVNIPIAEARWQEHLGEGR
ncbi:MAG TPA: type II toxin-antitoxin system RelE/ParE family toxin [Paenarthrobacter sp.]|nr:type II toxin-antitoxin system RelE/ParE family toxin [Paenarthrobacter sp.]